MSKTKRLLCLVMAVVTVLGILVIPASAKAKAPISLCVMTDRTECGYLGVVTVTITLKNVSDKDLKNVIITSSDSEGLVTYRPVLKNVLITNPCATPLRKKDSITTCLKPGGMMKYTYCVLLGYQYSFRKIPESTSILMAKQHRLLDTKLFRRVSLASGGYVQTRVPLAFCDVPATLLIKAYYNTADDSYDAVAAGEEVVESRTKKAETTTKRSTETTTASGSSRVERPTTTTRPSTPERTTQPATSAPAPAQNSDLSGGATESNYKYVLNKNTQKIHRGDCQLIQTMSKTHLVYTNKSIGELLELGYVQCGACNPT